MENEFVIENRLQRLCYYGHFFPIIVADSELAIIYLLVVNLEVEKNSGKNITLMEFTFSTVLGGVSIFSLFGRIYWPSCLKNSGIFTSKNDCAYRGRMG